MTAPDQSPAASPPRIDIEDDASATHWCGRFGVTIEQLSEAVTAVGTDPDIVAEHLLNQGASAGAG